MQCDCSEEYGPCEQHAETLVTREGASLHSAEELTLLVVSDLMDCGVILTDKDHEQYEQLSELQTTDPHTGVVRFTGDEEGDVFQAAVELADRVKSYAGYTVVHNDGYVIYRVHEDCPLLEV